MLNPASTTRSLGLIVYARELLEIQKEGEKVKQPLPEEKQKVIDAMNEELLTHVNSAAPSLDMIKRLAQQNPNVHAVGTTYNFLNRYVNNFLEEGNTWMPALLAITLLEMWFKEYEKSPTFKHFSDFDYMTYIDLADMDEAGFIALRSEMMDLAEKCIVKLLKFKPYTFAKNKKQLRNRAKRKAA